MEAGLFVLLLIVELVAIVDALRGVLPGDKKLLWVLLILFVPFAGVILYYLLGRPDVRNV